jgi:hypothetical protein
MTYLNKKIRYSRFLTFLALPLCLMILSCARNLERPDHVYYNGQVYTVDSAFTVVSAFAVRNGKIFATGSDQEMLALNPAGSTDLLGKFVYPGFQDAHCHFYGFGTDKFRIWLTGTTSFEAVLDTLAAHRNQLQGDWLFGRGWDQNDWTVKEYPDKDALDSLFPEVPVFLLRIDGHAALANQVALDLAGITTDTRINGGIVEKKAGKLTGILIDSAVDLVYSKVPGFSRTQQVDGLLYAQQNCFAVGLTSVTEAGLESAGLRLPLIMLIDSLQKEGKLNIRINAMAAMEDFAYFRQKGKVRTSLLKVHGFKIYADGALGSRGACLSAPYSDMPGHSGFLIHSPAYYDSAAAEIASIGFQMSTHCIGDSAHHLVLSTYTKHVEDGNPLRWRIEHAQVTRPDDLELYRRMRIIPSVQPVHATSDMYWAERRLGPERVQTAYAYRSLLEHAGMIAGGSDFPVESINPLYGFYAAVVRKDHQNYPEGGYQKENGITRRDALRAMTIWSAYAAFSEEETGSLEKGKYADFVITDDDLMTAPEDQLWKIAVMATYVEGVLVYRRDK